MYIHLLDLLSTPFLPVFGFSFPACCNLVCAWSLDDLLPLLRPFTTMFLDSPSHFIPTDNLTQLHLVTFQKSWRSGWINSVPSPTGSKTNMIRTYWETVFKTQSLTKNSNNAPTIIIIVVKENWNTPLPPPPPKKKWGKVGGKTHLHQEERKAVH